MLAACAPHARWIDVFCEPASAHAFDRDAARTVLAAGRAAGLGLRVHATSSPPARACGSRSSWGPPAPITAPT
jgi:imidazolonepropionase